MAGAEDRPFHTLVERNVQTIVLHAFERLGGRLAQRLARIHQVRLGAGAVASIPLVVLALEWAGGGGDVRAAWVCNLAVLSYFQITFAWIIWDSIKRFAPELDDMVSAAPAAERAKLLDDVLAWHRPARVLLAVAAGASFAVVAQVVRLSGNWSPSMFIAILLVGGIGGHSAYTTSFGVWLLRALLGVTRIRVTWHDPASTPALAGLSRVASRTARLGLVLLLLSQPPLIYMFLTVRSSATIIVYAVAFIVTIGLITATGIGAQVWLSRRVDQEKRIILADLSTRLDGCRRDLFRAPAGGLRHGIQLMTLRSYMDVYRDVSATSSSYLRPATVTQYAVSVSAIVVQFGVPVVTAAGWLGAG